MLKNYESIWFLNSGICEQWGCNGTQKSRFSTYLGFGVTVWYKFGKTGKKKQQIPNAKFLFNYFEQTLVQI